MSGHRWFAAALTAAACVTLAGAATRAARADDPFCEGGPFARAESYAVTKLVADQPGQALRTDPRLVNPWGIAAAPGGAFWVNDNGIGLSTLYTGTGDVVPVTFVIPGPGGAGASSPTGMIFNSSFDFLVPGTQLPAAFVFSTEDGTLSAWAPNLPTEPTHAVIAADNSRSRAVYKGLASGSNAQGNFLFATNFRAGRIDVFDRAFAPAGDRLAGQFVDRDLPSGYAPFGIQNIDGNLYVTFAVQGAEQKDDLRGPGHGVVDVFDTDGRLLSRFAGHGRLNSPWGVARIPFGFGAHPGDILIGNFGDGRLDVYSQIGTFCRSLADAAGHPITVEGLWAVVFGGAAKSNPQTLFFTSGPGGERHGLFGSIARVPGRR